MKRFFSWCGKHFPLLIVLAVLLLDQSVKFWIKLHMRIGEEIPVFGWFRIHFLENEGMAFGFSFGGQGGKLLLSLIRLAAIGLLIWYIGKLNRTRCHSVSAGQRLNDGTTELFGAKTSLLASLALILAGAIGNMIDCAFYGLIFSESYFHVAELFPASGGYAPFLHGHVVDMLYFPLVNGHYPDWFPFIGGREFLFFRPVFNIADASITLGFFLFFFTQRSFWWPVQKKTVSAEESEQDRTPNS